MYLKLISKPNVSYVKKSNEDLKKHLEIIKTRQTRIIRDKRKKLS